LLQSIVRNEIINSGKSGILKAEKYLKTNE